MRCLACNAEMHLVDVVEDTTTPVQLYEQQTWRCSSCGDVEQRTAIRRTQNAENRLECAPQQRPCAEKNDRPSVEDNGHVCAEDAGQAAREGMRTSAWNQAIEKLTTTQAAARQRNSLAGKISEGVRRLEEFLGHVKQRYSRGVPIVSKRAVTAAALRSAFQTHGNNGKDVGDSTQIKALDLWENSGPAQKELGQDTATNLKDDIADVAASPPLPSDIHIEVDSKPLEAVQNLSPQKFSLQNFDQLWDGVIAAETNGRGEKAG